VAAGVDASSDPQASISISSPRKTVLSGHDKKWGMEPWVLFFENE
ncbi:hypothetical protein AHiyo6_24470, partial [Arthrobacter sp. Hiyo6]